MKRSKRKVAVVLSGGGAKGAYEAGALMSIVKKTQDIHMMTGASIGAINAAVFAWEYEQTGDMIQAAESVRAIWSELGNLFRISFLRITVHALCSFLRTGSALNFTSIANNKKIKKKLKELIPEDLRISDLKRIELAINATCLTEGKSVTFTRENDAYVYEAVLASSSIPILFETQAFNEGFYVDGGLFNNTPLRDALAAQATDVFIVELKPKSKDLYMKEIQDSTYFRSVYQVGSRMVELITDKIMYEDLKKARKINKIIDVIMALEAAGTNPQLVRNLKNTMGYQKNGRIKRYINFYEIAPLKRLDPPGTLGFDQKEVIDQVVKLGKDDAEEQLEGVFIGRGWNSDSSIKTGNN